VQTKPDGTFFMPQYIGELVSATRRENLKAKKVFAMYSEVLLWNSLEKSVKVGTSERRLFQFSEKRQAAV